MALKGNVVERPTLYEGMVTAMVVAVNPTEAQITKLTGGQLTVPESPAIKERETDDGESYKQARVRFLLLLSAEDNPAIEKDTYTLADFYISDRDNYQTKKGGYWIGTSAGQVGYNIPTDGTEETALVEVLIPSDDKKGFVTDVQSVSILKDGEKELFIFLSKLFNIDSRSDGVDVNYKELFFPNVVEGNEDFSSLQDELDERQPKVRMLAYVDNRGYQKIDVRSTLNTVFSMTDVTYESRLENAIKRQHEQGYKVVNDAINEVVKQRVFDPANTEDSSSIENAADALDVGSVV